MRKGRFTEEQIIKVFEGARRRDFGERSVPEARGASKATICN